MPTFKVSLLSVCPPDSAKLTKRREPAAHVHVYRTSLREAWLDGHGGGRRRRLPRPRGAASGFIEAAGPRPPRKALCSRSGPRPPLGQRTLSAASAYRGRSHRQTFPRPVNFQPEGKLLPHFLIGSGEGPAISWPSHWPRRKRRRGLPYHLRTRLIGPGAWLILFRFSRWSTTVRGAWPPRMKTTKGRGSLAGGRRRCSRLPRSSWLRVSASRQSRSR